MLTVEGSNGRLEWVVEPVWYLGLALLLGNGLSAMPANRPTNALL